jgi:pimeloyl-ACP methyl ester carboxylesterase
MKHFYGRYPNHSALGRMVGDMSDLVTSLSKASIVDPDSIYVVGSGLGAKVGLFLAALDQRVRGVVSVCGFSSLRDRAAHEGTEGLNHYTHLHGLLPRLAGFAQRPESVPIDYDDVLALIAPRPTLLMAPTLDRYHKVDSVRSIVEKARTAFAIQGDEDGLELETPEGFNGFEIDPARKLRVIQWLEAQAGL